METKVRIFLSKSHARRVHTLITKGSEVLEVPVKVLKEGKVEEGKLEIRVDKAGNATLRLNGKKVSFALLKQVRQTFKVK